MRATRMLIAAVLLAPALLNGASKADPCDSNWPTFGHDLARSGAAACSTIGLTNVATLHPEWVFNTSAPVTAEPAVVDGVAYVGAADGTFYAINAADGSKKWSFTNTDSNTDSYGVFTSSAAVATVSSSNTKVVVVGGNSTLYVLDANTGSLLASQCLDPRTDPSVRCKGSSDIIETESSPAVIPNADGSAHIFIGMDYNESGPGRAGMLRFTLMHNGSSWTLQPDWKFDPEALTTYTTNIYSAGGAGQGCGGVWGSPTIDKPDGLVFFGTSNCATGRYTDTSLYGGESVFAISSDTGALAWCFAPRPVNDLDEDFGATTNLLPNGNVGIGGKDGSYYSFPRLAANAIADTNPASACRGASAQPKNWSTQVSTGGSIQGIIGTPATGIVNVNNVAHPAVFITNALPCPPDPTGQFASNGAPTCNLDPTSVSNVQLCTTLHAVDSVTGKVLWNAPNVAPAYAGPSYANGLVFMPDTFDMQFTIYSADLGVPVWTFPMFAPAGPPAIVGDSVYIGSGVEQAPGTPILSSTGAVWAFSTL
ncbi:MAG: outer membrane protein assembly factor BamB family protein [Actinomycetota bacterium]